MFSSVCKRAITVWVLYSAQIKLRFCSADIWDLLSFQFTVFYENTGYTNPEQAIKKNSLLLDSFTFIVTSIIVLFSPGTWDFISPGSMELITRFKLGTVAELKKMWWPTSCIYVVHYSNAAHNLWRLTEEYFCYFTSPFIIPVPVFQQ
jgi:hypothetical protein